MQPVLFFVHTSTHQLMYHQPCISFKNWIIAPAIVLLSVANDLLQIALEVREGPSVCCCAASAAMPNAAPIPAPVLDDEFEMTHRVRALRDTRQGGLACKAAIMCALPDKI